jgi:predicted transcriptional regulator
LAFKCISFAGFVVFACAQCLPTFAQHPPSRFSALQIRDLDNHPAQTPCIADGHRLTMIIYADPDSYKQNEYFVDQIKKYVLPMDEFCGYGVVNLKDTFMPAFMLRFILRTIRNRSEPESKAVILTDPNRILAQNWKLGDCNNKVVTILLDNRGDLLYWKSGGLNEVETAHFIELVLSRVSRYSLRANNPK